MKRNKMELALINDLSELPLEECRYFVTKLDIGTAGSKVRELQNALQPFYLQGRALLEAKGGLLLGKKRLHILKNYKNVGDKRKIGVAAVRRFARKLGINNVARKNKTTLLKQLKEVETLYT